MGIKCITTNFTIILCFILLPLLGFSQKQQDSLFSIWKNTQLADTTRANAYNEFIYKNYFENKTDSAYAMALRLMDFTEAHQLKKQKADVLILLGGIEHIFGDTSKAAMHFGASLELYKELNNIRGQAKANNGLGVSYKKVFNLDEAKTYYEKSLELSKAISDTILISQSLINIGNIYNWRYKSDKALEYFTESLRLSKAAVNKREEAVALINISSAYIQKKDFKRSESYTNEAIKIGDSLNDFHVLVNAYRELAFKYLKQKDYDNLIPAAEKVLDYGKKTSNNQMIGSAYYYLLEGNKGKRNFDLTVKYLELVKEFKINIDDLQAIRTLAKIKIDNHRTKDSLIHINHTLKAGLTHQNEKANLFFAWGGSLALLSGIAFLVYINIKRKQHKAEKERQEEINEKEKILKDLELSTIDAMIEGQEKERQRLASDLHDSVGASVAAAKLQFEYFVTHQNENTDSEELTKKISTLLEDAYAETRSMSHLKNSGVMAKNGLLPAVERLAENASGINGLEFEVHSFGLDQRLENTMEISIFRMIQELVTNVLKHAKATQGTIHITNHFDNLNIMVEDNGVGFNPNQLSKTAKGIGISCIDKRVEHLEGKLTIESEINKGTTVIIDIPL
ncbi:tetratricopeptide repeat-containing sensor histidine kinase [Winogradskyella helgolandensis]|uniref:tetratricopeptide repeat-containing sensor histidine kinase n=1 Tax=Winogradskyella helgolandensis TaxID=2697010 RepID=UPI0015C864AA|nr:tetratricopeptide repeat protein [Winogradskyella helgolandensis]